MFKRHLERTAMALRKSTKANRRVTQHSQRDVERAQQRHLQGSLEELLDEGQIH